MKHKWIMLLAVFGLLVGCSNGNNDKNNGTQGGGKPALPVVFEGGAWASELGAVKTAAEDDGADDTMTTTDGNMVINGAPFCSFVFAEPIDVSAYTKLVIDFKEKTSAALGYWIGGQLFCYYEAGYVDDDGEVSNTAKYGFWDFDDFDNGRLTFAFARAAADSQDAPDTEQGHPVVPFDKTKFYGFGIRANNGNPTTVIKITLE